ncbi:MarR family winged helix-turn-helix transcriptional regulator [Laceyella sacchari]|uniref:MarR family winged helix-turn-helix transcriptional regulator n=1 Tax=Laceyella sacchari TaxID=37482 RepID=UPI0035C6827E
MEKVLNLDNHLCFTIYACFREISRLYRHILDPLGITYTQYLALLVLWEQDGVTLKELGQRLYLDSGTLTPLMKKLEAMGLVTRKRSTEDERKVLIHLTDAGRKLKEDACRIPEQLVQQNEISPEELSQLMQEARHLFDRLQKVTRGLHHDS